MFPKQKLIWNYICEAKNDTRTIIGYGGDVGSAKTGMLCLAAWKYLMQYPGCRIMIARDTMLNMRNPGGTMDQFYKFAPCDAELIKDGGIIAKRVETNLPRCEIRMPHWPPGVKSTAYFRGTDQNSFFKSAEITALFLEEADDIQEKAVEYGFSRLRQTLPNGRKPKYLMMAVSNPAISWFKTWFIDELEIRQARFANVGRIEFFPSLQEDNPLLGENYGQSIKAVVSEDLANQMVGGLFSTFEGQIFPNITEPTHGIPQKTIVDAKGAKVILGMDEWHPSSVRHVRLNGKPTIIPKFDYHIGGLDFGGEQKSAHLTTGIVSGITKQGRDIRIDCFADNGTGVHDRLVNWMLHMEEVLNKGERITWVGDKTQTFGLSMLRRAGFKIQTNEGSNDSWERGIDFMRKMLAVPDDGPPRSMYLVSDRMKGWVREMQQYRMDPDPNKDGEYKTRPIKANDDRVDCDRYRMEGLRKRLIYATNQKPIPPVHDDRPQSNDPFASFEEMIKSVSDYRYQEASEILELVSR
jgi:hypothetical protein